MFRLSPTFVMVCLGCWSGVAAQSGPGPDILRLDPALDAIVSPKARVDTLKSDYFGYTEGPVWVPEGQSGYLLFSDMAANKVYKWAPGGEVSVFLDRAGFSGREFPDVRILNNGRLSVVILGTNGMTHTGIGHSCAWRRTARERPSWIATRESESTGRTMSR
jgi:hypothetical protein